MLIQLFKKSFQYQVTFCVKQSGHTQNDPDQETSIQRPFYQRLRALLIHLDSSEAEMLPWKFQTTVPI